MRMGGEKIMALIGTAMLAMGVLAGYSGSADETTAAAAATTTAEVAPATTAGQTEGTSEEAATSAQAAADLSGSVSMIGSTSMGKFANALSELFMEKYPKVTVTAESVGSGAGVEVVNNGSADIGNSSRNLKDEEKANGVTENIMTIDGTAVVVDPSNTVEDLTRQQLSDLHEGKVTNQKDVEGSDAPVVVVGYESGSGTRSAFEEPPGLEDLCKYNNELDSTDAMMTKVASAPGSIGYVPLDALNGTVKALKLEGAKPTEENIKVRSYFLGRPFVAATKGDISQQNDLVKVLLDYIYSEEGIEIVESVGLIAVNK